MHPFFDIYSYMRRFLLHWFASYPLWSPVQTALIPRRQSHYRRKPTPSVIFHFVVREVPVLSHLSNMAPQICVGEYTFPIATALCKLDESYIEYRLPIISCSTIGNGYMVCVSSVEFLKPNYFNYLQTKRLFSQLSQVIVDNIPSFAETYCLGFSNTEIHKFKTAFDSMRITIHSGDFPRSLICQTLSINVNPTLTWIAPHSESWIATCTYRINSWEWIQARCSTGKDITFQNLSSLSGRGQKIVKKIIWKMLISTWQTIE